MRELRKWAKTHLAKANYIRALQNRGVIKKLFNEKGHLCYEPEELKNYQSTVRWEDQQIDWNETLKRRKDYE